MCHCYVVPNMLCCYLYGNIFSILKWVETKLAATLSEPLRNSLMRLFQLTTNHPKTTTTKPLIRFNDRGDHHNYNDLCRMHEKANKFVILSTWQLHSILIMLLCMLYIYTTFILNTQVVYSWNHLRSLGVAVVVLYYWNK